MKGWDGLACRPASDSSVAQQLAGSQDPLHACFRLKGSKGSGWWAVGQGAFIVVVLCHVVSEDRQVDGSMRGCSCERPWNQRAKVTARIPRLQTALVGVRVVVV